MSHSGRTGVGEERAVIRKDLSSLLGLRGPAVTAARAAHGVRRTGTIAEKHTWVDCGTAPQGWTMDRIFNALYRGFEANEPDTRLLIAYLGDLHFTEAIASFEDKWGPAAGFTLDCGAYGFCGSESS